MESQEALKTIEAIRDTVLEGTQRAGLDLSLARLVLPASAYEQITREAPFAQIAQEVKEANILNSLTPEKQERAKAMQVAFAEKFSSEETPLAPKDFGLVAVGEGKDRTAVVMLTTGNGLYEFSLNPAMIDKKRTSRTFAIEVDGQEIDTRDAMTWETYQAFIAQAKANGTDPLPDSLQLSEQNDEPHTGTWLTGEEASEFGAVFAYVYNGEPRRCWNSCSAGGGWSDLRIRPSAVV